MTFHATRQGASWREEANGKVSRVAEETVLESFTLVMEWKEILVGLCDE